jgi:hypothetical protein
LAELLISPEHTINGMSVTKIGTKFKQIIYLIVILIKKLINLKMIRGKKGLHNLLKINKKNYNGLFERPTQSLASHIQILSSIEAIKFININFDLSWGCSIAISSGFIRLFQIPTLWSLKYFPYHKILPEKINIFFSKWYSKLILNDLLVDCRRNKYNNSQKKEMLGYYDPRLILSYVPQVMIIYYIL